MPRSHHVMEVCRLGQREHCCRYLSASRLGFECEKRNPEIAEILDARVRHGDMVARGDNCPGKVGVITDTEEA